MVASSRDSFRSSMCSRRLSPTLPAIWSALRMIYEGLQADAQVSQAEYCRANDADNVAKDGQRWQHHQRG
jgi:hypothetical protein